jgi:hypothetical protein
MRRRCRMARWRYGRSPVIRPRRHARTAGRSQPAGMTPCWRGRGMSAGAATPTAARLPFRRAAQLPHQHRDGFLADPPFRLTQRCSDPSRSVPTALGEQAGDLGFDPLPPRWPRRELSVLPLVKSGPEHAQNPARHRVEDAVISPLGSDEVGHGCLRPVGSWTRRRCCA